MAAGDDRRAQLDDLARALARIGGGLRGSDGGAGSEPATAPEPLPELNGDAAAARDICARLLAARMRSRHELATALARRGVADEVATSVLDRLERLRLVDDAEFARAFVADHRRERALGRTALRAELIRRGVDRGVADAALADIDVEDEYARARAFVASRLPAVLRADPQAARRRLYGQLQRRGYPADLITTVVADALADVDSA